MKETCPFCSKELCRINRLRYHIENSVCSHLTDENEQKEILKMLDMPTISDVLKYFLKYIRKTNDYLSRIKELTNECLYVKSRFRSLNSELEITKDALSGARNEN
jgi:uncharacterized protein (UPF0276 family)